tara:strand:+ start:2212 stop:3630 length:1419 start_codon:yes stop_codon:yes gene_type:complete
MFFGRASVYIDVETTGVEATKDRITEIACLKVDELGKEERWQSLINPGIAIPASITRLTGIDDDMVRDAPYFYEVLEPLVAFISDANFIAHNARFDAAFIRNECKRAGHILNLNPLCTVKLSKKLYPQYHRHGLARICERFDIVNEKAHRAMSDVVAMYTFVQKAVSEHGLAAAQEALSVQKKHSAWPTHLPETLKDELPFQSGVYFFYGDNDSLLYIGKSVNIRERVLSHFNADHSSAKEMQLAMQVKDIRWQITAGDLGAQLLEDQLIKHLKPMANRRQRAKTQLYSVFLKKGKDGYLQFDWQDISQLPQLEQPCYGLFANKPTAKKAMQSLAKEHHLCSKRLGLEKASAGPCFGRQLKRCQGACTGEELAEYFNARLLDVLSKHQVPAWPYSGAVAIEEPSEHGMDQYHVVSQWRYLTSVATLEEAKKVKIAELPPLDKEGIKLLRQAFTKPYEIFELDGKHEFSGITP